MGRDGIAGLLVWVLSLMVWATQATGESPRRVALLLGNADYSHVAKLANPANDARDIGAALERIGFTVMLRLDLDDGEMRRALRDFAKDATEADVSLIYYAGHGIEIDNTNYLIPVNAELKSDRDAEFEAIRLESVVEALSDARGLKIVLVDACRHNPFAVAMAKSNATRSIGRGLARVEPSGMLVGYSARGGTMALDGEGRNSPYAAALLQHLEEPGLELGKLFRKVRDTVQVLTAGVQEPFTYGSLPGEDVFLVPAAMAAPVVAAPVPPAAVLDARIVEDYSVADKAGSLLAWTAFVSRHGAQADNPLVQRAIARRDALQAERDAARAALTASSRPPWLDVTFVNGEPQMTRDQRILFQRSLKAMGYDIGAVDGEFGPMTLRAVASARFKMGLPAGSKIDLVLLRTIPDPRILDALKSDTARVMRPEEFPPGTDPRLVRAVAGLAGVPILFDHFQGHLYIVAHEVQGTWGGASTRARRAGGYLATISSAEENSFLVNLFSRDPRFMRKDAAGAVYGPMFGLFQQPGSREPAGGWGWENGEPLRYTNWSQGNPDNHRGATSNSQEFGRFFRNPRGRDSTGLPRFWDDSSGYLWGLGYIVEID